MEQLLYSGSQQQQLHSRYIAEPEAEPLKRRIYYTTAFILARLNKVNNSKNVTGES